MFIFLQHFISNFKRKTGKKIVNDGCFYLRFEDFCDQLEVGGVLEDCDDVLKDLVCIHAGPRLHHLDRISECYAQLRLFEKPDLQEVAITVLVVVSFQVSMTKAHYHDQDDENSKSVVDFPNETDQPLKESKCKEIVFSAERR